MSLDILATHVSKTPEFLNIGPLRAYNYKVDRYAILNSSYT